MILRTITRISGKRGFQHREFPSFYNAIPSPGMEVELTVRELVPNNRGEDDLKRYPLHGVVSALQPPDPCQLGYFLLDNVIYQCGSSGAAVFLEDGSIVGVLIRGLPIQSDEFSNSGEWHTLPLISPIAPLIKVIDMVIREDRHA